MTSATEDFIAARDWLLERSDDAQQARDGFQWPRLTHFNWAIDYFDVIAKGNTDPALVIVQEDGSQETLSYAELRDASSRLANWLRRSGVKRGETVLLMLGNQREIWESMLALIKVGAVIVPSTMLLSQADLQDRVDRGQVRHVITDASNVSKFESLNGHFSRFVAGEAAGWLPISAASAESPDFSPGEATPATDPLILYFTSGTTSKPKLVLHSHQSYPVGHLSTMYWIGLRPGDMHLNISSPGWAKHAWSSFFAPWNAGACIVAFNYTRFQPRVLLKLLQTLSINTLCAPPTVWRMLIQEDLKNWSVKLRALTSAGEPLNAEVIDKVREAWGLDIRDGFGQSESTCLIGNARSEPIKPGSMGKPMPGQPVVLLDGDGKPAEEGEICLDLGKQPVGLMTGYLGNDDLTREVMHDGFYHTRDLAFRDADGYITYLGRNDDVFKSSDYRLSPFELESALIEHPDVAEAAVVPSPDERRLTVPKAFVILRPDLAPSREVALSILAYARDRLAPYQRVRRLEFADLPKTLSGKIQRGVLKRLEHEGMQSQERREHEYREDDFPEVFK